MFGLLTHYAIIVNGHIAANGRFTVGSCAPTPSSPLGAGSACQRCRWALGAPANVAAGLRLAAGGGGTAGRGWKDFIRPRTTRTVISSRRLATALLFGREQIRLNRDHGDSGQSALPAVPHGSRHYFGPEDHEELGQPIGMRRPCRGGYKLPVNMCLIDCDIDILAAG